LLSVTIYVADVEDASAVATAVAPVTSNASAATAFLSQVNGLSNVTISAIVSEPKVVDVGSPPSPAGGDDDREMQYTVAGIIIGSLCFCVIAGGAVALCCKRRYARNDLIEVAGTPKPLSPTRFGATKAQWKSGGIEMHGADEMERNSCRDRGASGSSDAGGLRPAAFSTGALLPPDLPDAPPLTPRADRQFSGGQGVLTAKV